MPVIRALVALAFVLAASLAWGQSLIPNELAGFPAGVFSAGKGSSAPVAPAFDPAFNPDALSNSNRTVTSTGPGNAEGWRTVTTHSAGKIVARWTWSTIGCCGSLGFVPTVFANINDQTITYIGFDQAGKIWLNNFNGCVGAQVAVPTAGQTIDIAMDFAGNLLWVRVNGGTWNNSGTANPSTGVGGFDLTCAGTATPPAPPLFMGISSGFTPDVFTLSLVPDANTGALAGFTNF